MSPTGPLADRIAVVTGATRGLGRAAALGLAEAGAHVIAVGRTQGALEDLDDEVRAVGGHPLTLVPLNLTEGDSIDRLGGAIFERHARLDILVHAAGVLGGLRPVAHTQPKQWDTLIATDLTAAFRLIRSFEPLLRASDRGRAIFLTDGQAAQPTAFWGAYAAAKAGTEALVRSWADEMEHTAVRAVLLDPGPMRSKLRAEAYPGEDLDTLTRPSEIAPLIVELAGAADLGQPTSTVRFISRRAAGSVASSGTP